MRAGRITLRRDTRGLATVEYTVRLCLVAITALAAWRSFGEALRAKLLAADALIGSLPESAAEGCDGP